MLLEGVRDMERAPAQLLLHQGAIKAFLRLYEGSIKELESALAELHQGCIKALLRV